MLQLLRTQPRLQMTMRRQRMTMLQRLTKATPPLRSLPEPMRRTRLLDPPETMVTTADPSCLDQPQGERASLRLRPSLQRQGRAEQEHPLEPVVVAKATQVVVVARPVVVLEGPFVVQQWDSAD